MTRADIATLTATHVALRQHLNNALTAGDLTKTRRGVEAALRALNDAAGALATVEPDPEPVSKPPTSPVDEECE